MLDAVMTAYYKFCSGLITTLSGSEGVAYEETSFYDLGYMQTQVSHIKKDLASVEDSLRNSIQSEESTEEVNQYRNNLMKKREMLIFHLIFTMSNSFSNLDNCKKLAEGHSFQFMTCVEGLEEYKNGNKGRAFDLIEGYYKDYGSVERHFLINKVFGLLLKESNQYKKAIPFLSYASGFVPDDEEILTALIVSYQQTGRYREQKIITDINSLLGYREVS